MKISSTLGGLAGACTLTVLNEALKKIDKNAPHLDVLGMNAAAKIMKGTTIRPGQVQQVSLASDLLSNSLYFGMANAPTKKETLVRGSLLGLGAGIGAITLAKPLGLDARAAETSPKVKVLTIALYIIGGLAAAAVINLIDKKSQPVE